MVLKTTSAALQSPSLAGDVGYNLPASGKHVIKPGEFLQVGTGIKVELPEGVWGAILPRSSTNRSGKILALAGVIDNGYRGELTVMVHNLEKVDRWRWLRNIIKGKRPSAGYGVVVEAGQSLAQLVLFPVLVVEIELVDALSDSHRGEKGYGSTGQGIG